jgi:3D (Asp-Asp-Asp) domain-containing protein
MASAARTQQARRGGGWRVRTALRVRAGVAVAVAFLFLAVEPGRSSQQQSAPIPPGQHETFTATAYCDSGTTKAGVRTRSGVAAADPDVLPVGSVVRLQSPEEPRYEGIYTVMDTGSAVQGHRIDLFIANCREAKEFGLKRVLVRVLRAGWNPRASAPASR